MPNFGPTLYRCNNDTAKPESMPPAVDNLEAVPSWMTRDVMIRVIRSCLFSSHKLWPPLPDRALSFPKAVDLALVFQRSGRSCLARVLEFLG